MRFLRNVTTALSGFALTLGIGSGTSPVAAGVIEVPADFPTINLALLFSQAGDTVSVAAGSWNASEIRGGTYPDGTAIRTSGAFLPGGRTLLAPDGPGLTTLRLDGAVSVAPSVVVVGESTLETLIEGFTITATMIGANGLYAGGATTTIRNCRFENLSTGIARGGGILAEGSNLRIEECTFSGCSADSGAGVFADQTQLAAFSSNFSNLSSTNGADFFVRDGAAELTACGFEASAVYMQDSSIQATGCNFVSGGLARIGAADGPDEWVRFCSFASGGVYFYGEGVFGIEDCRFDQNSGVHIESPDPCVLRRSVIRRWTGLLAALWFASPGGSVTGNVIYDIESGFSLPACVMLQGTFRNNIVAKTLHAVGGGPMGAGQNDGCNVFWEIDGTIWNGDELGAGSVVADPEFCDPENGVFTVSGNSPCLPANSNGCGLIGVFGQGCGAVSVEPSSWTAIKAMYR